MWSYFHWSTLGVRETPARARCLRSSEISSSFSFEFRDQNTLSLLYFLRNRVQEFKQPKFMRKIMRFRMKLSGNKKKFDLFLVIFSRDWMHGSGEIEVRIGWESLFTPSPYAFAVEYSKKVERSSRIRAARHFPLTFERSTSSRAFWLSIPPEARPPRAARF